MYTEWIPEKSYIYSVSFNNVNKSEKIFILFCALVYDLSEIWFPTGVVWYCAELFSHRLLITLVNIL